MSTASKLKVLVSHSLSQPLQKDVESVLESAGAERVLDAKDADLAICKNRYEADGLRRETPELVCAYYLHMGASPPSDKLFRVSILGHPGEIRTIIARLRSRFG